MTNYKDLLLPLSIKAGEEIMKYFGKDYSTSYKSDKSPVTDADLAANAIIIEGLKETGLPVISEESDIPPYELRKKMTKYWIIDPLDGTKQFVNNAKEFTVNIALIENCIPIEGVIYTPALKLLYYGNQENGAVKMELSKASSLENAEEIKLPIVLNNKGVNLIVSKSHLNKKTQDFIDIVSANNPIVNFHQIGSSLKFCSIADGSADIYPRIGSIMEWDIAAGHAILRAANGHVIDVNTGEDVKYNTEQLRTPDFIAVRDKIEFKKLKNIAAI